MNLKCNDCGHEWAIDERASGELQCPSCHRFHGFWIGTAPAEMKVENCAFKSSIEILDKRRAS